MHPARRALEVGLLILALSAPLAFGGVPPVAVFLLQAGSAVLAVLAVIVLRVDPAQRRFVPRRDERRVLYAGLGIAAWFLLQWIPLPAALGDLIHTGKIPTDSIPGLGIEDNGWTAISYMPSATLDAAARWAAALSALFSVAVACRRSRFSRLLAGALVGSAFFQSGYGLWEYLSGHQQIWGTPKVFHLGEATGTFVNRNHFGAYLVLLLPLAVERLTRPGDGSRVGDGWRRRLLGTFESGAWIRGLAAAATTTVWLGVVFSYSRGAFLAAILGIGIFLIGFGGRKRVAVPLLTLVILLPSAWMMFSAERAPGERIVQKFQRDGATGNRLAVWNAGLSMAKDHPWTGTGAGTFGSGFPHYQPPEVPNRWDHAHNEYLQAAIEGGPVLILLLAVMGFAIVRAAMQLRRRLESHRARIGFAAFAGLTALAGQAVFDFPLRLPGIAITAAMLIGCLVGTVSTLGDGPSRLDSAARREPVG